MKKSIYISFFCLLTSYAFTQSGEWVWMKGDSITGPAGGNFGIMGTPSSTNTPPGVYEACDWTDLQGNFWIFGGQNYGSTHYNALWIYDVSSNMWTWVKGPSTANEFGVYGTQGVPSSMNVPGARAWGAMTWVDQLGDLWLFGGHGYDAYGNFGCLSDLWKYHIPTNEWTWVKGPNVIDSSGVTGIMGIPNPSNTPSPREENNLTWTDSQNNLWLYGGWWNGGVTMADVLWKFNITTNMWTWVKSANTLNYGVMGIESPSNDPGPNRHGYSKFIDSDDNLYFFLGGPIFNNPYTELWKYNPVTNNWTWMAGLPGYNTGNYTTNCDTVSVNLLPSSRNETRSTWPDSCGFWFFGGDNSSGYLSDLWYYNLNTNKFIWVAGDQYPNNYGNYGTQGISSTSNYPSARNGALSFTDAQGNLWLFGGMVNHSACFLGCYLNDLWKYTIDPLCVSQCSESFDPKPNGIYENDENIDIRIFPNPSYGEITIDLTNISGNTEVKILDAIGRTLKQFSEKQSSFTINISDLPTGVYFLILKDNQNNIIWKKFVKN